MKKNVLMFGFIIGAILTGFMLYFVTKMYNEQKMESNQAIGFLFMGLTFALMFIGIKNVRDRYSGGVISFGKAFKTGFLISLVAATIYVAVWLVYYYLAAPDFIDKYTTCVLNDAREGGASQAELDKKAAEMSVFKEMYRNPMFVVLITYFEVLPVGLAVSLIGGLLLKRKSKPTDA